MNPTDDDAVPEPPLGPTPDETPKSEKLRRLSESARQLRIAKLQLERANKAAAALTTITAAMAKHRADQKGDDAG